MLDTHCSRKPEAETLYRTALEVDPRHSYALYNLAVLLEEIALDRDGERSKAEIANLYRSASEADPRDPAAAADYGRFLLVRYEDYENAEPYLVKALKLDEDNEVGLYNLALLYHKYRKLDANNSLSNNQKVALEMYRRLAGMSLVMSVMVLFIRCTILGRNANHLSCLLQLARLLVTINADNENSTATDAFSEGLVHTNSKISQPTVDSSKVAKAWMEEVIEYYEAIIPKHKEV